MNELTDPNTTHSYSPRGCVEFQYEAGKTTLKGEELESISLIVHQLPTVYSFVGVKETQEGCVT